MSVQVASGFDAEDYDGGGAELTVVGAGDDVEADRASPGVAACRPGVPGGVIKAAADAAGVEVEVMERAIAVALDGGPDKVVAGWCADAACGGLGAERFYPRHADRGYHELVATCRGRCPVQAECLGAALAGGERQGLWGGTTGAARARMRGVLRHAGLFGVTGEAAYVSWEEEGAGREPPPLPSAVVADRVRPWPHQLDAVGGCAAIGSGGRCLVTMAPASGKTRVGLWTAAALSGDLGWAGPGGASRPGLVGLAGLEVVRVLVQVPSLSLVGQTVRDWRSNGPWPAAEYLAVCSDTDAELSIENTTSVERVRSFAAEAAPGRPSIVVSTYHSSPVLVEAGVGWDLAVCDEAHHLAGDRAKTFAAVVRGEIRARRILFMSAIPRRYRKRGRTLQAWARIVGPRRSLTTRLRSRYGGPDARPDALAMLPQVLWPDLFDRRFARFLPDIDRDLRRRFCALALGVLATKWPYIEVAAGLGLPRSDSVVHHSNRLLRDRQDDDTFYQALVEAARWLDGQQSPSTTRSGGERLEIQFDFGQGLGVGVFSSRHPDRPRDRPATFVDVALVRTHRRRRGARPDLGEGPRPQR